MNKTVSQGAVQRDQEAFHNGADLFIRHSVTERLKQFAEIPEIYGKVGHGRDILIHDLQGIHCLIQCFRRIQSQKFTSVSHKLRVIRQDIPGDERCVACPHLVHLPQFHQPEKLVRIITFHKRDRILCNTSQIHDLLLMCLRSAFYYLQRRIFHFINTFKLPHARSPYSFLFNLV